MNLTKKGPNTQNSLIRANSTSVAETSAYQASMITSEIKQIWQLILDSSKSSPESLGLFEDDLSAILSYDDDGDQNGSGQRLSENVQMLIKESLQQMYADLFKLKQSRIVDPRVSNFTVEYSFGLDETTIGALNLMPQVLYDMRKRNRTLIESAAAANRVSLLPAIAIPPTFRLMASLEKKNILALKDYLGLPILMIKRDELFKFANRYTNFFGKIQNNTFLLTKSNKIHV